MRVWVATSDQLVWRQAYLHEKEVECEGDSVRKAGAEEVDRLRSDILTNHGSGVDSGMEVAAQASASNGQAAFQECCGFLNVLDLQPDAEVIEEGDVKKEAGRFGWTGTRSFPRPSGRCGREGEALRWAIWSR